MVDSDVRNAASYEHSGGSTLRQGCGPSQFTGLDQLRSRTPGSPDSWDCVEQEREESHKRSGVLQSFTSGPKMRGERQQG